MEKESAQLEANIEFEEAKRESIHFRPAVAAAVTTAGKRIGKNTKQKGMRNECCVCANE